MRTRLRPGERLILVARRHWIGLAVPCAVPLFLAGCVIAALAMQRPPVALAAGIALAVSAAWALWRWLDWRCDIWAVTSHRVVDESGVLAVRVVDSPLDKIHNVACEQSLMGRLLGYGTVLLQTAAEAGRTIIEGVAAPNALKDAILEMQDRDRQAGRAPASGEMADRAEGAVYPAETRECPHCAERIKARARICRYCGLEV